MSRRFPRDHLFVVGKSEKGYITFETLFEYICNEFYNWLVNNNIERPVIVFSDWHETRNNYYLVNKMNELGIIMVGLLPNTTHLCQPLDVSVFRPLKANWARAVREFEDRNPGQIVSQTNFAQVAIPLYYNTVSVTHIRSGFRKCGLYPWNPDAPDYTKLQAAAAQRESPATIFEGIEQRKFQV